MVDKKATKSAPIRWLPRALSQLSRTEMAALYLREFGVGLGKDSNLARNALLAMLEAESMAAERLAR